VEQYRAAFTEFKKYAVLNILFKGEPLGMASKEADAVLH